MRPAPLSLLIVFGCISLLFTGVKAEIPPYHKFTASDGLPSSTVFDILQDRDGFIWIAGLGGVVKYDGLRFTTFRAKDGLNVTSTVALAQKTNGDIFFGSYENGISVLRNGKIRNYFRDTDGKQFLCSYLFITNDPQKGELLWIYKNSGRLHPLRDIGGKGARLPEVKVEKNATNRVAVINDRVLITTNFGLYELKAGQAVPLDIDGLPRESLFKVCRGRDGSFLVGSSGMIYRVTGSRVTERYRITVPAVSNEVNEMIEDRSGNIWFSLVNGGIYMIDRRTGAEIDIATRTGLKNTNITSLIEDREGNIWIGTYGKGVFCFHNRYLSIFNEFDGLSNNIVNSVMVTPTGEVVAGTTDGVNVLMDGKFFRPPGFSLPAQPEYIYHVDKSANTIHVAGVFYCRIPEVVNYRGLNFKLFNRPAFHTRKGGTMILALFSNGIDLWTDPFTTDKPIGEIRIFSDSVMVFRINDIMEDNRGNIWLATSKGLCRVRDLKLKSGKLTGERTYFPDDIVAGAPLKSVTIDRAGDAWFTGEKGIAVYRQRTGKITSWTKFGGADLSQATSIAFDAEDRLWIGTMSGLYIIDGSRVHRFNRMNGLPSSEVLSLSCDTGKNNMYIGTSDGLVRFDIALYNSTPVVKPDVRFVGFHDRTTPGPLSTTIEVQPENRNIRLDFSPLLFASPDAVTYRYGFDGKYTTTDDGFVSFANLDPGEHSFSIIAIDGNSHPGKPLKMVIDVIPVFTETLGFRLILISIFLVVVFIGVRVRLNSSAKKAAEELKMTERINELKHQALSAMMNPHFVFNSLNSVQYLVNSNRNEDANNYIAMMAQLMRKNLDASASGFILISEEIDRLKLYLELEKMRFSDKFDYRISVDDGLSSQTIMIPNMIIQPFVENSIWHGLSDSKSDGLITIHFGMEEDSASNRILRIRITDNGIGISNAMKKRNNEHISRGMSIIEERLKLLSVKMEIPKPIVIDDLGEKAIDSSGTEIIISLPGPLYKYTG